MIQVVLKFMTWPGVDVNEVNKQRDTAMHLAAGEGHLEIVEALLQQSSLSARNDREETALHACVKSTKTSVEIVGQLIVSHTVWRKL